MAVEERARPRPSTKAPRGIEVQRQADEDAERGAGHQELRRPEPEDGAPHQPDALRAQLEADEEQKHQDAELGDFLDDVDIRHEAEPGGPDQRAGDEIAKDRAEAEPA